MPPSHPTPSSGREKLAQARAQQAKNDRNRKVGLIAGATALALAVVGGGVYLANRGSDDATSTATTTSASAGAKLSNSPIKGVSVWTGLGRQHVEDANPTYPMTPPTGGNHNQAWANCGIYDKQIPNKYAVHSLEHGAVWITYNDKASKNDIANLKQSANQDYILMSKYPSQDAPIIVSAWEHQIKATSASDPRIEQFLKEYRQGPQTPEPGASCTGAYDPNTGTIAGVMPR